jgi:hypothetical protein
MLLDALGFVGDALDRPGAAVRGLLAGRPDQLANLLPGAETIGLLDPSRKVSGRDLLRQYGLAGEDDNWGNYLAGMAVDALTNPLTYAGPLGAGRLLGRSQPAARLDRYAAQAKGQPSAGVGRMLGKRRGFDVIEVDPHASEISKIMGGAGGGMPVAGDDALLSTASRMMEEAPSGLQGMYRWRDNVAAFVPGADPRTVRHEVLHGLVDQAVKQGNTEGLPFLSRLAANAYGDGQNIGATRSGLATLLDELQAFTYENRGLKEQLRGAGRFLFNNPLGNPIDRGHYASVVGEFSPAAANLYRAVGYAPHALGGAATAGLGLGLAKRLWPNGQPVTEGEQ